MEVLIKLQKKLEKLMLINRKNEGLKWYVMLITSVVVGVILYFGIIPSINYIYLKSRDNQELKSVLQEFIPDISIQQTISDELMLLTWDFNNRMPYVFTKSNLKGVERYQDFDSLLTMTLLSACNPLYFKPCVGPKNQVFISGDATAISPAMLSFLHATENGKKASDIEIVSIGATKERPDKIPEDIGVIEWAFRITSL